MSNIHFRRARRDDLDTIVAMLSDDALGQTREDTRRPLNVKYIAAFAAIESDSNQLLAVAEHAGEVVGCLQLTFIPGLSRRGAWRGQIESVRIAANQRGSGLGRTMIEWAITQCRARGCGLVQLTSDKSRADAVRFYESIGFAASHEGLKLSLDQSE